MLPADAHALTIALCQTMDAIAVAKVTWRQDGVNKAGLAKLMATQLTFQHASMIHPLVPGTLTRNAKMRLEVTMPPLALPTVMGTAAARFQCGVLALEVLVSPVTGNAAYSHGPKQPSVYHTLDGQDAFALAVCVLPASTLPAPHRYLALALERDPVEPNTLVRGYKASMVLSDVVNGLAATTGRDRESGPALWRPAVNAAPNGGEPGLAAALPLLRDSGRAQPPRQSAARHERRWHAENRRPEQRHSAVRSAACAALRHESTGHGSPGQAVRPGAVPRRSVAAYGGRARDPESACHRCHVLGAAWPQCGRDVVHCCGAVLARKLGSVHAATPARAWRLYVATLVRNACPRSCFVFDAGARVDPFSTQSWCGHDSMARAMQHVFTCVWQSTVGAASVRCALCSARVEYRCAMRTVHTSRAPRCADTCAALPRLCWLPGTCMRGIWVQPCRCWHQQCAS